MMPYIYCTHVILQEEKVMAWEFTGCFFFFFENSLIAYRNIDIYLKYVEHVYSSRIRSLWKQLCKMYIFGPT